MKNVVAEQGGYGIQFIDGQYYLGPGCCDGAPLMSDQERHDSANGSPDSSENPLQPFEVRVITR